jgi:uncharacterized protein YdeI (BOF family)
MKHLLGVASVVGFAFCAAVLSASPGIKPATIPVVASAISPLAGNTADQPQKFVGTIVSMNGERYVLRDDVNEVWYHLDNQQEAGKYLGKKVEVTGTLEGRSDEILVQSIHVEKS